MERNKSYPFFTYSGLLNSEHYDKMGSAVWLFLWFISSTTKERRKDGVNWGIVLGHKPLKAKEMADVFGVSEKTVRRWLDQLEKNGYILVRRAPYGVMISVRHSKKFIPRTDKQDHSDAMERTKMPQRADNNVLSDKDNTMIHTAADKAVDAIANHFTELRSAQEGRTVYPSSRDYQAIARIVGRGVPVLQTIKWLDQCFDAFEKRRTSAAETIKAFSYCAKFIDDRFSAQQVKKGFMSLKERNMPNDQTNARTNPCGTEKRKTSITGEQIGRIRRKPL
ncbi:DeoR family transcriptional regulator [Bacillus atrophaeus]|uniref:DeoR family transcriptional regulator n=1 Tax=Bacillus atrophaeus TaxID=1452 RepID=UPI000D0339C9|nr:HTH domain-containing protein [Bacillus atrophaeus]PRR97370.1 phage portal protein [Bacillus atrophaeus]